MTKTRMQQMTALGADWWNDSCDLRELSEAVDKGAVGATSNPVIVYTAVSDDRERWEPVLDGLIRDHPAETEDDIAWRLIAEMGREAASILHPVCERTKGIKGYLSMQVNPKFYPDRDRMVEQGSFLASLAPNVAIKTPAIESGIAAMEELSARGIRINATVSFSVSQAIAAAEGIERGLKRAGAAAENVHPYVTIMVGRVDDHLKRVRERDGVDIAPEKIDLAGVAVFKHAAGVFRKRGYRSTLLAAAYRNEGHWSHIIGRDVLQTIPYKWWKSFDEPGPEPRLTIDEPVDDAVVKELTEKFPDFRAAYEGKGMRPADFVRYGGSVHTLKQFIGGYEQLLGLIRDRMLT